MVRRVSKTLSTLASAASLVLCVAASALWVRTVWAGPLEIVRAFGGTRYTLRLQDARLTVLAPPRPPPRGGYSHDEREVSEWPGAR